MSFKSLTFQQKIKAVNGHFEWFKTSTLHTLISLTENYPTTTGQQIAAELARIPDDKQTKYKDALDYLRAEIPMGQYAVSQADLKSAIQKINHVVPHAALPPVLRPDVVGKLDALASGGGVAAKAQAFDKISRRNVVLSGHGCWLQEANGSWPMTRLAKGQELHLYCPHATPLGNDVGQRIDSHQAVPPVEKIVGPADIWDYTLQEKETLALMNRMEGRNGQQLDARFITVDANTRLSQFLGDDKNSTAVFHWAACRVVFSKTGELWDPAGNRWKQWNHVTKVWV